MSRIPFGSAAITFFHLLVLLLADASALLNPIAIVYPYSPPLYESLSHLTSSPERYAASLGLTVEDMKAIQANRSAVSQALHQTLQSTLLTGPQKHILTCQHVMTHGRHAFVCRTCWTYQAICLCRMRELHDLPVQQVILWTHHDEWGSVSNTGSVLPLLLKNVSLKLKGLPEHDAWFNEMIRSSSVLPVVLWTDHDNQQEKQRQHYTIDDLKRITKPVVLIAMEGTWRNARRMVSKLPSVGRCSLSVQQLFGWRQHAASLRPQAGDEANGCTAEAVVGALVALGLDPIRGEQVMQLVEKKMEWTRQYQGHDW